jgi:hypothetical protein
MAVPVILGFDSHEIRSDLLDVVDDLAAERKTLAVVRVLEVLLDLMVADKVGDSADSCGGIVWK